MAINKGIQFGRYAEVEVKNYTTGEIITIPNRFEIDFEFFKTIDENENASVGTISIKGLTQETYKRMNSEGGSVTLRCGYANSEIKPLFIAMITRMWQVRENGTTKSNINDFAPASLDTSSNTSERVLTPVPPPSYEL